MTGRPRVLTVEEALWWAYNDELPKREASPAPARRPSDAAPREYTSATSTALITELGPNRFGVLRSVGVQGTAHPDAVLIGEAVNGLNGLVTEFPEGWAPLFDLAGLNAEVDRQVGEAVATVRGKVARGERIGGTSTAALVRRHALGRTAPEWTVRAPEVRFVSHPNGQPKWFVRRQNWSKALDGRDVAEEVEEDGMNPRQKRPYGDAYRKVILTPSALDLVETRAAWELWHAALSFLAEDLAGRLTSIHLLPFDLPAQPWAEPEEAPSTAPSLADLAAPLDPADRA